MWSQHFKARWRLCGHLETTLVIECLQQFKESQCHKNALFVRNANIDTVCLMKIYRDRMLSENLWNIKIYCFTNMKILLTIPKLMTFVSKKHITSFGDLGTMGKNTLAPQPLGTKPEIFADDTVDGRNPAPLDMENLPSFIGFYTSQVVQDFFHQQYFMICDVAQCSMVCEHAGCCLPMSGNVCGCLVIM